MSTLQYSSRIIAHEQENFSMDCEEEYQVSDNCIQRYANNWEQCVMDFWNGQCRNKKCVSTPPGMTTSSHAITSRLLKFPLPHFFPIHIGNPFIIQLQSYPFNSVSHSADEYFIKKDFTTKREELNCKTWIIYTIHSPDLLCKTIRI